MGVRAPPEVTSLVTPSQALAVLDTMNVPETELFEVHDDISVGSNPLMSEDSLSDETLPLPNLSQVMELPRDFVADTLGPDYAKPPHKWDFPDPIQAAKLSASAVSGIALPGRSDNRLDHFCRHKASSPSSVTGT